MQAISMTMRGVVLLTVLVVASTAEAQLRLRRPPTLPPPTQGNPGATPPSAEEETAEMDAEHKAVDEAAARGDYPKVVELASILLAKDPKDYFALHLRATAKIELARQARDVKGVREGIADAREALGIAGKKAVWLFVPYMYGMTNLAELEQRPEHADVAIKVVDPVLAQAGVTPVDRANLYYQRGLAHFAKRDHQGALTDFDAALKEVSQHVGALVKRAEAYAALNKPDDALKAYDLAVERAPSNLIAHNDRGAYRRYRGNLEGAVADFSKTLELDPNFGMAYLNRGISLYDLGQYEGAESDFAKSLELKVQPTLALRMRGLSRVGLGRIAPGVEDLTELLKQVPTYATGYEDRGLAKLYARDYSGAATDFRESLKHDPRQAHVYAWLSLALARAGDSAGAIAAVEPVVAKTVEAAPWTLLLCQYLKGDADEAALRAGVGPGTVGEAQRLCEAEFFVGQKKVIAGDAEGAKENFAKAIATKANLMAAFRGARFETGDVKVGG
jgi:tetratricopeptide (TPR) repeat protein